MGTFVNELNVVTFKKEYDGQSVSTKEYKRFLETKSKKVRHLIMLIL